MMCNRLTLPTVLRRIGFFGLCVFATPALAQSLADVPGVVISHQPAPSALQLLFGTPTYLSSPSLTILPNGDYLASHDLFGGGSGATTSGTTRVFRSTDKGATWTQTTTLTDMLRGSLFVHNNEAYLYGYAKEAGDIVIRKSSDGGSTWTANSVLIAGSNGGTPNNPVVYNGRIWTAQSTRLMSAPVNSDLLSAASWTRSNAIAQDPNWLNGTWTFWTEGQVVAAPHTGVVVMPKSDGLPVVGLIKANPSNPGNVTFTPDDFVDVPGAEKKFGATYDAASGKFYILDNPVLPAHASGTGLTPQLTRNTAAVLSSTDLRNWEVEKIFLYSNNLAEEAWQYFNFKFDGDDMAVVSRTAFFVGGNHPPRGHDSNLMTFHRIEDFRSLTRDQYLVADTAGDRVLRWERTGHDDAPLGTFTLGGVFDGAPLNNPNGLAQAGNGDVYVREQGGRILRFDALGNFVRTVGSLPPGLSFNTGPLSVTQGTPGEQTWITGDGSWEQMTNWYYWGRADTRGEVATFGSANTGSAAVSVANAYQIRGLRFRDDGSYTLSGAGKLILNAETGRSLIDVQQGAHQLNVQLELGNSTDLSVADGASLDVGGPLRLGGRSLSITGAGSVTLRDLAMGGGELVLDGLAPLTFAGAVQLDGTLRFVPDASLPLARGQTFELFDGIDAVGDTFDSLVLPALDAGLSWDTSALYTAGTLTVVPEPGAAVLLLLGGAGVFSLSRHAGRGRG